MKKAILCIDDEKIILGSLKAQLKEELGDEFLIEVAESADEGFEVIDEFAEEGITILIIISDWLMPNMKGDEFLIRVHQKFPDIIKVMLTGQANQDAVNRAFAEANLYKVIHKPWDREELVKTIRKALQRLEQNQ